MNRLFSHSLFFFFFVFLGGRECHTFFFCVYVWHTHWVWHLGTECSIYNRCAFHSTTSTAHAQLKKQAKAKQSKMAPITATTTTTTASTTAVPVASKSKIAKKTKKPVRASPKPVDVDRIAKMWLKFALHRRIVLTYGHTGWACVDGFVEELKKRDDSNEEDHRELLRASLAFVRSMFGEKMTRNSIKKYSSKKFDIETDEQHDVQDILCDFAGRLAAMGDKILVK